MTNHPFTLEDALEAFASEYSSNPNALKKYMGEYPQFAIELVDLSKNLRYMNYLEEETSRDDEVFLNATLQRFKTANVPIGSLESAPDSFFKDVAKKFKIPNQIMLSIRERRVEPSTLSAQLLELIARALGTNPQGLQSFLSLPIKPSIRANKSDQKPVAPSKVAFEKILSDAQITSQELTELLKKGQ